jgi:hypothetical protein
MDPGMLWLPAFLAVVGLFVGRAVALWRGGCPHRGKVWGVFLLPLLVLPLGAAPLVLLVTAAAVLAAGLTAHSRLRVTVAFTALACAVATAAAVSWGGAQAW